MNRRGAAGFSLAFGLIFAMGCGAKTATTPTVERGSTGTPAATGTGNIDPATGKPTTGGTTTTPGGTVILPSQVTAKAQDFFNNKVLPLVKSAPCTDCHADPRIVVQQKGGLAPQNFDTMYTLLKDGKGANDNKLFNMMRGLLAHPGGAQCTTETAPFCSVLQEWYRTVFGDGQLTLGRVNDIGTQGSISGWSGVSTAPTTTLKVRFYIDGETGKVPMFAEATANLDANDNNIDGPHAFSAKIPDASIDNKPHKLYAYAVNNNTEVALSGSPYTYTAFKPKGVAVATSYPDATFKGCNGSCHAFTYETRWSVLLGGFGTAGWGSANNSLYNKITSGQHGGPAFPGGLNTALAAWFKQEFPETGL